MNKRGISAMYDAILFVTLVSISGAILLPAFVNNSITESEKEREGSETADESLIVLLSVTPSQFHYQLAKETINNALNKIGIDSNGYIGKGIFNWLLGIKEYHKNYGELIAEDMASQFWLSWENSNHRLNFLTEDFDKNLRENISKELNKILEGKYKFNLTAKWNPIIGLPFGGQICVGDAPPQTAYVSKTFITMPFSPVITIDGREIHLNKNWIKKEIEESEIMKNISKLISSSQKELDRWEEELKENLTDLMMGFLFTGIRMDGYSFPGILNISLHLVFEKILNYILNKVETSSFAKSLNNILGKNQDIIDFLLNQTLDGIYRALGKTPPQHTTLYKKLEGLIGFLIENISSSLQNSVFGKALEEYIEDFADFIVKQAKGIKLSIIDDWLLNRISISRAEISLAIWGE